MSKSSGSRSKSSSPAGNKSTIGFIRQLATLLTETNLNEIEVEQDDTKIRVVRHGATMQAATAYPPPAPAQQQAAPEDAPATPEDHPGAVPSPMVGTVYTSPEPGAEAFVKLGDSVKEGDTVLIVEAMKTFNNIPAPRSGTVTQILIENGQPVEFGQPLMIIE